jgi:hypothetical protein
MPKARIIVFESGIRPASALQAEAEDDGRRRRLHVYEIQADKRKSLGDAWVYDRASPAAKTTGKAQYSPPVRRVGPLGIVEAPASLTRSFVWSEAGDAMALARVT